MNGTCAAFFYFTNSIRFGCKILAKNITTVFPPYILRSTYATLISTYETFYIYAVFICVILLNLTFANSSKDKLMQK